MVPVEPLSDVFQLVLWHVLPQQGHWEPEERERCGQTPDVAGQQDSELSRQGGPCVRLNHNKVDVRLSPEKHVVILVAVHPGKHLQDVHGHGELAVCNLGVYEVGLRYSQKHAFLVVLVGHLIGQCLVNLFGVVKRRVQQRVQVRADRVNLKAVH